MENDCKQERYTYPIHFLVNMYIFIFFRVNNEIKYVGYMDQLQLLLPLYYLTYAKQLI